jgi:hypothetical protein
VNQLLLDSERISAFYTDTATADQVRNFLALRSVMDLGDSPVVVDVGGGQGYFARALQASLGGSVRVLDTDPVSVAGCLEHATPATLGDALAPPIEGDEQVACFNLILHHLVGRTGRTTAALQLQALQAWQGKARFVFVTEYVYESAIGAALIYWLTRSQALAAPIGFIGRLIPSLNANTRGVGVRYRPHAEWLAMFHRAGFATVAALKGREEKVRLPRRLMLITSIRRDTFLLAAK